MSQTIPPDIAAAALRVILTMEPSALAAIAVHARESGELEVATLIWGAADEQVMGPLVEARRRVRAQLLQQSGEAPPPDSD